MDYINIIINESKSFNFEKLKNSLIDQEVLNNDRINVRYSTIKKKQLLSQYLPVTAKINLNQRKEFNQTYLSLINSYYFIEINEEVIVTCPSEINSLLQWLSSSPLALKITIKRQNQYSNFKIGNYDIFFNKILQYNLKYPLFLTLPGYKPKFLHDFLVKLLTSTQSLLSLTLDPDGWDFNYNYNLISILNEIKIPARLNLNGYGFDPSLLTVWKVNNPFLEIILHSPSVKGKSLLESSSREEIEEIEDLVKKINNYNLFLPSYFDFNLLLFDKNLIPKLIRSILKRGINPNHQTEGKEKIEIKNNIQITPQKINQRINQEKEIKNNIQRIDFKNPCGISLKIEHKLLIPILNIISKELSNYSSSTYSSSNFLIRLNVNDCYYGIKYHQIYKINNKLVILIDDYQINKKERRKLLNIFFRIYSSNLIEKVILKLRGYQDLINPRGLGLNYDYQQFVKFIPKLIKFHQNFFSSNSNNKIKMLLTLDLRNSDFDHFEDELSDCLKEPYIRLKLDSCSSEIRDCDLFKSSKNVLRYY